MLTELKGERFRWSRGLIEIRAVFLALMTAGLAVVAGATATTSQPPPALGRAVNISLIRGRVLVQEPGQPKTALSGVLQVPVGTIVDSSSGAFALTAAGASPGITHSGQFNGSSVRVLQSPSQGGLTEFQFTSPPACGQAVIAKIRRPQKYRAHTASDGYFETSGRFGSATASGSADWTTSDDCQGTHITNRSGALIVNLGGRTSGLPPGVTGVGYCSGRAPDLTHYKQCISALSNPHYGFGFALVARQPASQYRLCLSGPKGPDGCHVLPLRHDDFLNAQVSVALCPADQGAGRYAARWSIRGLFVGIPLSVTATRRIVPWQCHEFPTGNFGKDVGLEAETGMVFVSPPGHSRHRVQGSTRVPVGSVIDLRHGQGEIVSATPSDVPQSASFYGSPVRVSQPTTLNGTTVVRMMGGNFGHCRPGQFAVIRGLGAVQAMTGLVVAGRFAGLSTVAGTANWVTLDRCDGTYTLDTAGRVRMADAFEGFTLAPDVSATDRCSDSSSKPDECLAVISRPGSLHVVFHLGLNVPATEYTLCIRSPNGQDACVTQPFAPSVSGPQTSDLDCVVNEGRGTYEEGWGVNGRVAGLMPFDVTRPRDPRLPAFECAAR